MKKNKKRCYNRLTFARFLEDNTVASILYRLQLRPDSQNIQKLIHLLLSSKLLQAVPPATVPIESTFQKLRYHAIPISCWIFTGRFYPRTGFAVIRTNEPAPGDRCARSSAKLRYGDAPGGA